MNTYRPRRRVRWMAPVVGGALLALVALSPPALANHGAPPPPVDPATSIVVRPVADAYVNSGRPTTNYGGSRFLRADASPDVRSYLRFTVEGAPDEPRRTILQIKHSTANSSAPFCDDPGECIHTTRVAAHAVASSAWEESTLTYESAPPVGELLGTAPTTPGDAWYWVEIDLGHFVDGDGTYELALVGTTRTNQTFGSREAGSVRLVVLLDQQPSGT